MEVFPSAPLRASLDQKDMKLQEVLGSHPLRCGRHWILIERLKAARRGSHPLCCGRHWIRTGFPRRPSERHLTSSVVVVCVGSWSLSPGWCGRRVSYRSAWRSQEGRIFLPSDPRRGAVAGPCGPLRVLAASGCWVVAAPTLAAGDPGAAVAPQPTRPSPNQGHRRRVLSSPHSPPDAAAWQKNASGHLHRSPPCLNVEPP